MNGALDEVNRTVWLTTVVVGLTLAVAGFHHGLFEALQGNSPTGGILIASIGPEHVRWEYGTDEAMTLIPNFLVTGIAAMLVSVTVAAWSVFFLGRRYGPAGFLALFVLLTLVGGGIGHVVFFLTAWAFATRIRSPLSRWSRLLRPRARAALGPAWLPALATSSVLFLVALEISVWGFMPGVTDPDAMLNGIWLILLAALVALNVAYVAAISRDVETQRVPTRSRA